MSDTNSRKRTITDAFSDDLTPTPKRIKLMNDNGVGTSTPQHIALGNIIKNRSKIALEKLRENKLEREKQEHLKQQLREEIVPMIQAKAQKARSNPVELIKLFFPTLEIPTNVSSKSDIQKTLKKALVHCHPDKAAHKSLRERVEKEEIFKLLSAEKQKFERNSDRVRIQKKKRENATDFAQYYKNKTFVSSAHKMSDHDIKITLSNDRTFIFVKGKTYPIKEELKQFGLGWNPKQHTWQIRRKYFSDSIRSNIAAICENNGYSLLVNVDDTKDIYLEDSNYDFRIWYESDEGKIYVTPHIKMNAFWRTEGFVRNGYSLWIQYECVFYEGYLEVIRDKAVENGLVFGYCGTQKNPTCDKCNIRMRIYTARKGNAWNYGRKFFKCFKCKAFLWIDGTEAYSDAAGRRCQECETDDFGYNDCMMM